MPIRRTSNKSSQDTGYYNPEVYSDVGSRSVNTLWTPVYINTDLWLDASDTTTITTAGSGVSQWDDKSGKNRNFVQATGVLQPVTNSSALNNLNVLTFASSYVKSNSTNSTWTFLHNTSRSSIFFVVKPGLVSDPNNLYGLLGTNAGTALRPGMYTRFDDRQASSFDNNVISVSATSPSVTNLNLIEISPSGILPANNWNILGVELNLGSAVASGRCVHYVNGIPFPSSNTYNTSVLDVTPSTSLEIGSAGSGVWPLFGNIAEVVIISGVLSSGNRQLTEGYLAWKWGLVSGLAAGHPYKNSPPYAAI